MESYNNIQEDIKEKIIKSRSNFKKSPKERLTVSHIETRLETLEKQWSLFGSNHNSIIGSVKKSELHSSDYHKNSLYDYVEELYIEYKSELKEKLRHIKGSGTDSAVESGNPSCHEGKVVSRVKLPEIKIASFSGKYSEWNTFRDLFIGLVHNNKNLENAQKFYYLKGHLIGEAEALLRNIPVNSENYKIAWEKLDNTYNNKRFLANSTLKTLLNQKTMSYESASDLKSILNTTSECLECIKNLGVDIATWDVLIIYLISEKLDKSTRKAWELKIASDSSSDLPTFSQFTEFLHSRYRALESLEGNQDSRKTDKKPKGTQSFHVVKDKEKVTCAYCSGDHKITLCKHFSKQSNDKRRDFAQTNRLCFICLYNNHPARFCRASVLCRVCKRRHHTLLHPSGGSGSIENIKPTNDDASKRRQESSEAASQAQGSGEPLASYLSTGNSRKTVLLTTAVVQAKSKNGTYRMVRALLDQGSQGSFITEATVQYLGLNRVATKHTVLGVGGDKSVTSKYTVVVNVRSRKDPNVQMRVNAYVLKSVTALLPATKVTKIAWVDLADEELADPEYYKPNKVDILLGAEVYSQVIQSGIKRNSNGSLLAQDTTLGWILSGVAEVDNTYQTYSHITVMHSSLEADDLLKRFWELEREPSETKKILTEEERRCEELFSATTRRDDTGRYVVNLPFRDADLVKQYGESKSIATRRLNSLEIKLNKNNQLKKDYVKVLQEYLDSNHMEQVPVHKKKNKAAIYLPHHAVIREDKVTTKVRVVFDASCKGSNGVSLNDCLLVGPTLQAELRHIIMRWRRHPICLVADIEKMYRQVLVDRKDTIVQRILWREEPEREVEEYELITVTFGTASAPYLAVRALHQVAYDECQEDPEIANVILNDFYMDDMMSGAENVQKGFNIYTKMNTVLSKCGFKLQKWISNSKELFDKIKHVDGNETLKIEMDNITKILGLSWNSNDDVFQYSVKLTPITTTVTKRKIISDIARLFDPLGWLAPSIILAKVFIQKLWLAGLTWDQEIPSKLAKEWVTYHANLNSVTSVRIPRWLHTCTDNAKIELHGFSDASKMAYGAAVYMRVIDRIGNIHVSLVTAKTKVAPIKQVSIPRLELCGAVLLTNLMVEVGKVMDVPMVDWHMWTDSEVVLAWLNSHPSRWKTFIGNRVSHILTLTESQHWCHVPSKENPADCASRGISPAELDSTSLWWEGPQFLRQQEIKYRKLKNNSTHLEEVKVCTSTVELGFWNRFSSLSRLVRVIAYCRRFFKILKKQSAGQRTKYLVKEELEAALQTCIKQSQEEGFTNELKMLKCDKGLENTKGHLKSLNIFLDSEDIIRVGGRLEMSQLGYDRVHPILIPRESYLTNLLVADAHEKTLHGGPQLMITYLRSKYWIIGIRLLAKKYVRNCVRCVRYAATTRTQLMGQLPIARVTPNKPFLCSGVDYAGPINIRVSKGRGNKSYKGYIALFICMSTRAVHLEAVSDLSTRGFLTAFKRFVARRGRVAEIYSDNGTNFVGAARELRYLYNAERSALNEELAEYLSNNGTQWNFIPPHAPNFGGLWEAGIKSTKYHLKRVIGNSTLTFEEIATVLAQIEACLNSRPLSYIEDQDKLTILTPGHFLVGEPLVVAPDSNYERSNISNLKRWQLQQRMMQDFWRRWSQDYLNQFLQRHKWAHQTPEPTVGDVVLVKEDDLPPGRWLLGRIEKKHPGPDEITRVVTLRTQNAVIKRPTSKLCVLPVK